MKTLLTLGLLCSIIVTESHAQEQRVTAKIKQQNTEHNSALEKATTPSTDAAGKKSATSSKKDPMGDLETAEKVMKYQVNAVKQAKLRADQAPKARDTLHATYKGKNLDHLTFAAVMKRYEAADKEVTASAAALNTAQGAFEILFDKYQKLGGKTDYRAQLAQ
jgi:hypothetical protein